MKREAFLRELKAEAKKHKLSFELDKQSGKGSHYKVKIGNKETFIKSGELSQIYVKVLKKQLGLI